MTLLLVLFICIEFIILLKFQKSERKLNNFYKSSFELERRYNDSYNLKIYRVFMMIVIIATFTFLRGVESYIVFLPMLTLGIIHNLQRTSEIGIYTSGIIINRKYIEWSDVEAVEMTSSGELIVVSNKLSFGQTKSVKLIDIEDLATDIEQYLK